MLGIQKGGNRANLRTVGGSVMVAIPPSLLDLLGLRPNAKVALSVDHGKLVIEPVARPSYTLAELMADSDQAAVLSSEDRQWLDLPPVGREAP